VSLQNSKKSRNQQRKEQRVVEEQVTQRKNALLALARELAGSWFIPYVDEDTNQAKIILDVGTDSLQLKELDFHYTFNNQLERFEPVHLDRQTQFDLPSGALYTRSWPILAKLKRDIEAMLELAIRHSSFLCTSYFQPHRELRRDEGVLKMRTNPYTSASVPAILQKRTKWHGGWHGGRSSAVIYELDFGPGRRPRQLCKPLSPNTFLWTSATKNQLQDEYCLGLGDLYGQCAPLWLRHLDPLLPEVLAQLTLLFMLPDEKLLCQMYSLHDPSIRRWCSSY
jgi:hypothetical protein